MLHQIGSFPPEVLAFVSHNLDQSSLLSCVLVNRHWNRAFTPALFINIRICPSGYHIFTSPDTIRLAATNPKHIRLIDSPHPTFAQLFLDALSTIAVSTVPLFPNLESISVMFDEDIRLSLKQPTPQPQFLYPSDSEDPSDSDDEDMYFEHRSSDSILMVADPTKGVYSDLFAPLRPFRDTAYLTQDPYHIIRLIRQCPNLCSLKIQVRALGNMGALNHLLWPGILPQSLQKFEIVVPEYWKEESLDNSDDEDYDPDLHPARDVEEEFEEDEDDDELNEDLDVGYDEDEVVDWYLTRLQRPDMPDYSIWNATVPQSLFNDVPMQPLLNLCTFVINNCERIRALAWTFMTGRCPHLRILHMIEPSGHFCEYLVGIPPGTLPELEELTIELKDDPEYFNDEYLSCVLGSVKWKTVTLRNCFMIGGDSFFHLAPTVEVLDLGVNAGSMPSGLISVILTRASLLRVFSGEGLYFLAEFAYQWDWACFETLEIFRCQFLLELPLFDGSLDTLVPHHSHREAGEVPDGEELQRRMMEQLGRCHQLQELDLSHWIPDNHEIHGPHGIVQFALGLLVAPPFRSVYTDRNDLGPINANIRPPWTMKSQNKCLEFTFETGLRKLEGLKKLRKVNLTGLKHRISVEELKWMKEAWPQLEQFEGLIAGDIEFEDENDDDREDRRSREGDMQEWLQGSEAVVGDLTFWKTSKRD
ncbi:hypothetical protein BGX26_011465 [Mortierella sp. AD094]|nr:hypothetical protein BGX26_011465 [Mortierella sp. AD094]